MQVNYDKYSDKIVSMYKSGKSILEISKIIGCSNRPISRILRENEVYIRQQGSRYVINDRFFKEIASEYQAYWLGMIATDGTIRSDKSRNEIVLSLQISDTKHIQNFIDDIGSTSKVYFVNRNGSDQAYASISSKMLKEDLIKLGITPNKSFSLSPPDIDEKIKRHFWRGCFDGDGCITSYRNKYWAVSFNGTRDMVEGFVKFLNKEIPINRCKIMPRCNIYTVSYRKQEDVRKIVSLLYSGSTRYLERKQTLADNIMKGKGPCE